jgi:hypothetical protein
VGAIFNNMGLPVNVGATAFVSIPYNATITGWTIAGDKVGSCVIDVSRATYAAFPTFTAIDGSEPPTLTAVQKNQDLSLNNWTNTLIIGDVVQFYVTSNDVLTYIYVTLNITKT